MGSSAVPKVMTAAGDMMVDQKRKYPGAVQHGQLARAYSNPKVSCFQMPLHYPKYTIADYEEMPEWKVDCLLAEYGLPVSGDLAHKRRFAMGAFLWPAHNSDGKEQHT